MYMRMLKLPYNFCQLHIFHFFPFSFRSHRCFSHTKFVFELSLSVCKAFLVFCSLVRLKLLKIESFCDGKFNFSSIFFHNSSLYLLCLFCFTFFSLLFLSFYNVYYRCLCRRFTHELFDFFILKRKITWKTYRKTLRTPIQRNVLHESSARVYTCLCICIREAIEKSVKWKWKKREHQMPSSCTMNRDRAEVVNAGASVCVRVRA